MKRDMDLVRAILLALAESDEELWSTSLVSDKYSREIIGYHFLILNEAGLIVANVQAADDDPYYAAVALRLTWEGNDFLDTVRDETIWNKVRSTVGKITSGASFEVFKTVASSLALEAIKLSLREFE